MSSLAGCSGKEGQKESGNIGEDPLETKELVISAGTSGSDIYSEAEELFRNETKEGEMVCRFQSMQYYKGEPVQLWLVEVERSSRVGWGCTWRSTSKSDYRNISKQISGEV